MLQYYYTTLVVVSAYTLFPDQVIASPSSRPSCTINKPSGSTLFVPSQTQFASSSMTHARNRLPQPTRAESLSTIQIGGIRPSYCIRVPSTVFRVVRMKMVDSFASSDVAVDPHPQPSASNRPRGAVATCDSKNPVLLEIQHQFIRKSTRNESKP